MHHHANLIELEARNNGSYALVSDVRCRTYKKVYVRHHVSH